MLVSVILFYAILFSAILSLISKRSSTLFCGIIAYSGSAPFDVGKIKSLFLFNASRGTDGCGMYNQGEITKSNGEIYSEILTWDIQPENIFLGHTRKATFASYKEKKHAHPFAYGNIVGVHNGTLTNHHPLGINYHIAPSSWDTDSEVLFRLIDMDPTNLKRIKGTASVAYVNITTPNILYCFRKDDARPLWRGRTEEGMYFSSIKESLEFIGCTKVEELKVKTLYTIADGNITCTTKYLDEEAKTTTTVTPYSSAYQDDEYCDDSYSQCYRYMNNNNCNAQTPIVTMNSRPMAHALSWVKIRKDDKFCRDNHGRIIVGEYYQVARKVEPDAFYASIVLHFDEKGLELEGGKTTNILYSVDCLEFLQVDKIGLVVFMADGKNLITTGDIGYVSSIGFKGGVQDENAMATYEVLYPFEAALKADNTKFKWARQYMRMATKEELYEIWRLHKEKTPYKIIEFLEKSYEDVAKPLATATKTTVMNNSQTDELKIDDVLGKLKSLTDKKAIEAYGLIHSYMVEGDDIFEAFRKVMFLMKDTITAKEEEDVVVDAETPMDSAITINTTADKDDDYHDVFPDTDLPSLKTTWLEFNDIIDDIATIKRTSEALSSLVSEIYNEGINLSCETDKDLKANDFESSDMFAILNTASLAADNLDTAITELIQTVVYDYYPTYAPKTK